MSARFGDVPLKHAMISWNHRGKTGDGRIEVIPHPDSHGWHRRLNYMNSTGACWCDWGKWKKRDRLLKLYIEAWHIIARDGVDPEKVHQALMVIPEYRDTLSGEYFFTEL